MSNAIAARGERWVQSAALVLSSLAVLSLPAACLERPVTPLDPNTSNQFIDKVVQNRVDKIDLLFMVDNSLSMADKQAILEQAVPVLVSRLISPTCVDEEGKPVGGAAPCAVGSPEFTAIRDIHIGVVTSSLGDMGAGKACVSEGQKLDDKAQLIATPALRPTPLDNWNGKGFLAWDPDADAGRPRHTPAGTTDAEALVSDFQNMIVAAGEKGCGHEASLESWYRFLIDPEPPAEVVYDPVTNATEARGIDTTILEQRRAFLRPDSLVAVIMLSDENDCSVIDYGRGGRVGSNDVPMPRANSACARSLDDPCCAPCDEEQPPGCPAYDQDPVCQAAPFHDPAGDPTNLRCHRQKERFGRDFLQPLGRYVDGLTEHKIYDRKGQLVENPLFQAPPGESPRDRSLVFLAGIVGVPWQDVADEASWSDPKRLRYLTSEELEANGRWDWMLGKDGAPPADALMFETPLDRTTLALSQTHPASQVGATLSPSSSTSRTNPINGHESNIQDGRELQYACIFPLAEPETCGTSGQSCDCTEDDAKYNRALCEGNRQTHAKAYPGTRQLEVLRTFGQLTKNSIVASICPKVTSAADPGTDPDYGYNPAVRAIIERIGDQFKRKCLPRPLDVDAAGQVPCKVVEARRKGADGTCPACDGSPGRTALASASLDPVVRDNLATDGFCGKSGPACSDFCLCEIEQLAGVDLGRCQTDPEALGDAEGYCYVDAEPRPGEAPDAPAVAQRAAVVADCPATQRRLLRFSSGVPAKGAVAYTACLGKTLR